MPEPGEIWEHDTDGAKMFVETLRPNNSVWWARVLSCDAKHPSRYRTGTEFVASISYSARDNARNGWTYVDSIRRCACDSQTVLEGDEYACSACLEEILS